MTFKKGEKRPANAGRKKGSKNKTNLGVAEKLTANNIDCVDKMLKIAKTTKDEQLQFQVYKELLGYIYPKKKAVDIDVGSVNNVPVIINNVPRKGE